MTAHADDSSGAAADDLRWGGAVRDRVHGYIPLTVDEMRGLDTPEVQRLRGIAQLGLTERVYPGARHSRFEHALGALEVVTRIFRDIRGRVGVDGLLRPLGLPERSSEFAHLLRVARWTALLHDLGHGPFSHVTESLLPGGCSHEQRSRELLEEGAIGDVVRHGGEALYDDVTLVMHPRDELPAPLRFIFDVISGPVGADRMDYLLRDSAATGVSYGIFDLDRLLHTLVPVTDAARGAVRLGVERGGVLALEGLLWARVSMFQQVYLHRVRRILDRHLLDFLAAILDGGHYERDHDAYLAWSDARVLEALRLAATDPGAPGHDDARRIIERRHHRMLSPELENDDPAVVARRLEEWERAVQAAAPGALPIADLVLAPEDADSEANIPVRESTGSVVPLRDVSALVGRLQLRPLGRLYVARDAAEHPSFAPPS